MSATLLTERITRTTNGTAALTPCPVFIGGEGQEIGGGPGFRRTTFNRRSHRGSANLHG